MKIKLLEVGKTTESYVRQGLAVYTKRINRYYSFEEESLELPRSSKKAEPDRLKQLEGERILSRIQPTDLLVLLDDRGKEMDSVAFAEWLQQQFHQQRQQIVFLVGGAYGVSNEVRNRADMVLSLSKMTFPHQLVRLLFAEQLYRACTIIHNEPYHHA